MQMQMLKPGLHRRRYEGRWKQPFVDRVRGSLRPGMAILDVGSGRHPAIPREDLPAGCFYAGLDISATELERAPSGAYDEIWVADVTQRLPELEGRFDLVVSFQVLEHVRPLDAALENCRAYLKPGGRFIAQLSGLFSVFALLNKLIPHRLAVLVLTRLVGRPQGSVFPAHYDRCWDRPLRRLMRPWSRAEVVPRYTGAMYFTFSKLLQRLYLVYEDWTLRVGQRDLATHYIIDAIR
jgi:SAM-dependent methyltransferase